MNTPERLTLLITAFNEQEALPQLHPRLCAQLQALDGSVDGRILYVDDGSSDATWSVMQQLAAQEPRVSALRLSRNFGKEAALTAGLDFVEEGAVILLDADGQDPPELIPQFVALWQQGHDDVYGTRMERGGDGWLKRFTAAAFYRVMGRLSKTPIDVSAALRSQREASGAAWVFTSATLSITACSSLSSDFREPFRPASSTTAASTA